MMAAHGDGLSWLSHTLAHTSGQDDGPSSHPLYKGLLESHRAVIEKENITKNF